MIKLFTEDEFNIAKFKQQLPLKCEQCNKVFTTQKRIIQEALLGKGRCSFCSVQCLGESKKQGSIVTCLQCAKKFYKIKSQIKKSPNHFCSRSCAATYNNTHKTHGTRRSKLEIYIEEQLTKKFPNIDIKYNDKTIISSELDIYIPQFKLAFELNGIFHYEPIFGNIKLDQIQNNDQNKFQQCQENNISLCIIDCSQHVYVTKKTSQKYLKIILDILEPLLSKSEEQRFEL